MNQWTGGDYMRSRALGWNRDLQQYPGTHAWEPHILIAIQRQYNISFACLGKVSVIFSHVGHIFMAAEAPNHHGGDLGTLEDALTGVHTVGHRQRT